MMDKESLPKRDLEASLAQSMTAWWQTALSTIPHAALTISGSRWEVVSSLRKGHILKLYHAYMKLV